MSKADKPNPNADLKNATLPVFFLQMGSKTSLFFNRVLKQAVLTNGADNVFILTDTNFSLYNGYNCIDISGYAKMQRPFDKRYKHHSANSYFFEKTCFDRWFIINDLIHDLGISHFIYADCDVVILQNLKTVYNDLIKDQFDGSMMFLKDGENSITSAHTSFWNSKLLGDFCNFIDKTYADTNAFERLVNDTVSGKFFNNKNVSDMILLDIFRTDTKPNTLNLLSLDDRGICFDFNVNAGYNGGRYNYLTNKATGIKKLTGKADGGLYGQAKPYNKKTAGLKFYTVHFQGYLTKALIPLYVRPTGGVEYLQNNLEARLEYVKRRLRIFKNRIKRFLNK